MQVPFFANCLDEEAASDVLMSLKSPVLSGNGPFSMAVERDLEHYLGARTMLTASGTQALEMIADLLEIKAGDEIIVPSFTFTSSALAFVRSGASPVFCDIDPETLNLDIRHASKVLSPRTRALIFVHYGGEGKGIVEAQKFCDEHGIALVEDAAHGLGGSVGGKKLGTFGRLSAFSFHQTKNFSCGEGGAVAINDKSLISRAEVVREKGTDRTAFFRGEVDKYTWRDFGSSYLLAEPLAALLKSQLRRIDNVISRRSYIWNIYRSGLHDWAVQHGVQLPKRQSASVHASHIFWVIGPTAKFSQELQTRLANLRVQAVPHYQPLHSSPMGSRMGLGGVELPTTEAVATRLLRLPLRTCQSEAETQYVISSITRS